MEKISPEKPAFLVGVHRSGTTLLGLMLDSHPELSWFHHFEWIVKYINRDVNLPSISEYTALLEQDRVYQVWGLSVDNDAVSYLDVVNGFLRQRRERDGKPLSGATIHTRYTELLRLWPDALFVHIVRDPRDVSRSTIKKGWAGNAWGAAKRWQAQEAEWERMCQILPEERRLLIKFEELVEDPVETLKRVTNFLGISYCEEMFSYTSITPYSYPNPKMALKWKGSMSRRDVEAVELAVGDLLTKRGYERTSSHQAPSVLDKACFDLTDRWNKFRWRLKRYGLKLWAAQFLARRLGFPRQLQWAIKETQYIDDIALKSLSDYVADPNMSSKK